MRIISLVPSATEMIWELGLGDHLVGVSHECDHPDGVRSIPKVTRSLISDNVSSAQIDTMVRQSVESGQSLYALDRETLISLKPDLVVTQSLCDVCAVNDVEVEKAICSLEGEPHILRLEPTRLGHVLEGIREIGIAAGIERRANEVVSRLNDRILAVQERTARIDRPRRVILLEWIDPLFCAGHWNPELVALAGGMDCLGRAGERSHVVSWDEIAQADPDVLVIACCGYSIARTQEDYAILASMPGFGELGCVRDREVFILDGNSYFNRPGPRLIDSLEILAEILYPKSGSSNGAFRVPLPMG